MMDQPKKDGAFEEFKEAFRVRGEVFQKVLDVQSAQMNLLQSAKNGKALAWSTLGWFDRWLCSQSEWLQCFALNSDGVKWYLERVKTIGELEGRIKTQESDISACKKNLQDFVDAYLIKHDEEFKARKNFLGYVVQVRTTVSNAKRSFSAFIRALESKDIPPERTADYIKSQWQTLGNVAKMFARVGEEYDRAVAGMLERSKVSPEYAILCAGFSESLRLDVFDSGAEPNLKESEVLEKAKAAVALCGKAEEILDRQVSVLEEAIGQYRSAFVRRCFGQEESGEAAIT